MVPIPGVSSITTSMSISGFDDKFLFYGFLPKTEKESNSILLILSNYLNSLVFFVPAVKINFYLKQFKNYFSGRKILIAKEITKLHETFYRNDVDKIELFKNPIKGELTIIISDKQRSNDKIDKNKIINKAKKYLKKYSLKDTVELIMETEKTNKKEIYKLCLNIKNEKDY